MNIKRVVLPILLLVVVLIFAQILPVAAQESALWRAEFFDNAIFAEPSVSQGNFGEIAFNWRDGSPHADVPSDGFSARFGADVHLAGGRYRFWALADDYVAVTIDFQQKVIDSFDQDRTRDVLTGEITLEPGPHHIQVDYRENSGDAYIFVGFAHVNDNVPVPTTAQLLQEPPPPGQVTGTTATVTAFRLNVRSAPGLDANILTKINSGEVYPVITQTADGRWVQINVGGTIGWVSASFVSLSATPPVPPPTLLPPTGPTVSALGFNVIIRGGPSTTFDDLGRLPANTSASLIGRNAESTWWQINYNGLVGWVSGQFARPADNVNVNAIPITG